MRTHSMRNVFQCGEAWEVDIQSHIRAQTLHQATAIDMNFVSCFLTYCCVVALQRRKILWCCIQT
jgi:hypothetical protein